MSPTCSTRPKPHPSSHDRIPAPETRHRRPVPRAQWPDRVRSRPGDARTRTARRSARLLAVLARRTSQYEFLRRVGPGGAHPPGGVAHRAHPCGLGRCDAPPLFALQGGRAVPHASDALSRPHRSRSRTCARGHRTGRRGAPLRQAGDSGRALSGAARRPDGLARRVAHGRSPPRTGPGDTSRHRSSGTLDARIGRLDGRCRGEARPGLFVRAVHRGGGRQRRSARVPRALPPLGRLRRAPRERGDRGVVRGHA